MSIRICDRCGSITVDDDPCRCETPCDLVEVRRRHREAVARARSSAVRRPAGAQPRRAA